MNPLIERPFTWIYFPTALALGALRLRDESVVRHKNSTLFDVKEIQSADIPSEKVK